jgi:excisionase family DNA binding protein
MAQLIDDDRLTLTVKEAARLLGLGETKTYNLARDGKIPALRFGRRIVIPRRRFERWLEEASEAQ